MVETLSSLRNRIALPRRSATCGSAFRPTDPPAVRAVPPLKLLALGIGIPASAGAQTPADIDWPVYLGAGSSQNCGGRRQDRHPVGRRLRGVRAAVGAGGWTGGIRHESGPYSRRFGPSSSPRRAARRPLESCLRRLQ